MAMMTPGNILNNDDHHRTVIHIDLDCFYAQVEMIKNPKMREVPMGVQQKHMVITSNYLAREKGIKKCMTVADALRACPELVLINGEDLYYYRQMSTKVTTLLQKYSNLVEKLGFDENYIDVSALISERLLNNDTSEVRSIGHVYGGYDDLCECGCVERLNIGSTIAAEMREKIKNELGLTSCAGIAHNKLIAKIAGSVHKPNQQTIVYPSNAYELLLNLPDIKSIPGIGQVIYDQLRTINIKTVKDLHDCPFDKVEKLLGAEKAKNIMNLSYGKDASPVKSTGKPQTISLEDACRTISMETEISDKFLQLLHRLMVLVNEDGRIPRTIKVTVRKFDSIRKTSIREQKQCNISPSFFITNNLRQLSKASEEKIMSIIMRLFHKLVDIKKPYNISLLGLAFTKFQDRLSGKHSIASFLMNNLSVQSVTSIQNSSDLSANSPTPMDCSSPLSDFTTDGSESEIEPSPKKSKFGSLIAKRRCFQANLDCPSPSKLKVSELRLNSREMDHPPIECPEGVDPQVFSELPPDVQQELITQWKTEKKSTQTTVSNKNTTNKSKPNNSILKYLIKNK